MLCRGALLHCTIEDAIGDMSWSSFFFMVSFYSVDLFNVTTLSLRLMAPKKRTERTSLTFTLDELRPEITIRTNIFFVFFLVLELIARILCLFRKRDTCSVLLNRQCKNENGLLKKWHDEVSCEPLYGRHTSLRYSDKRDKFTLLTANSIFEGSFYVHFLLVKRNSNMVQDAAEMKRIFRRILDRALSCTRYLPRFKKVIQFLEDIEHSSEQDVADFMQETAKRLYDRPCGWDTIVQNQMRTAQESNEYQLISAMASLELFYSEGVGAEIFYLHGYWKNPDRMSRRACTIIIILLWERLGVIPTEEDRQREERIGIERILLASLEQPFRRILSQYMDPESPMYKMVTMWEFLLNRYGDFMEDNWTSAMLERAVWALQHGRKYISKKQFDILAAKNFGIRLNLRTFDVRTLLVFSVTGMIEFIGFDACVFRATTVPGAKVKLSGYLPIPKVADMIDLGLMEQVSEGQFRMMDIPGCRWKHKGIRTGDRILLCRSKTNDTFRATSSTSIS